MHKKRLTAAVAAVDGMELWRHSRVSTKPPLATLRLISKHTAFPAKTAVVAARLTEHCRSRGHAGHYCEEVVSPAGPGPRRSVPQVWLVGWSPRRDSHRYRNGDNERCLYAFIISQEF